MQPDIRKYLYDIMSAIDSIYEYIGDERDYTQYISNKQLRRAVERELEIIGEAVKRLLDMDPTCPLTNSRKIVDTRNWVIHGYDKVDNTIIWGIVIRHLPLLRQEIEQLLARM